MDTTLPDPAIKLIDDLGAEAIKAATGVGDHAIRYARFTKKLPSRWYGPLAPLCDERGIECPLSAFAWAEPSGDGGEAGKREHNRAHGKPRVPRKGRAA